jgi:hypothetical protein
MPVIIEAAGIVTKTFKEKFRSHTRKTFNGFTTKISCILNITNIMESTAV